MRSAIIDKMATDLAIPPTAITLAVRAASVLLEMSFAVPSSEAAAATRSMLRIRLASPERASFFLSTPAYPIAVTTVMNPPTVLAVLAAARPPPSLPPPSLPLPRATGGGHLLMSIVPVLVALGLVGTLAVIVTLVLRHCSSKHEASEAPEKTDTAEARDTSEPKARRDMETMLAEIYRERNEETTLAESELVHPGLRVEMTLASIYAVPQEDETDQDSGTVTPVVGSGAMTPVEDNTGIESWHFWRAGQIV